MVNVLLADGFEEIEALVPVDLLRRAGIGVQLVSIAGLSVTGGQGIRVMCDITLEQIDLCEMQMLVVVN